MARGADFFRYIFRRNTRSHIVAAAATRGIASIDVPYFKGDDAGLQREALASRKLGMTGKAALRTEQLAAINAIFTPSTDAITHARAVAAAVEASGAGTPALNGRVIEPAMLREAERVLAIAAKLKGNTPAFADSPRLEGVPMLTTRNA